MILGLAGSHRSGKTTLARAVAARGGIAFYDGSFGRLARTLGYESVAKMSVVDRLTMQSRVLDLYDREIRLDGAARITDRTPLDMLAYLMAEVGMHAGLEDAVSRAIVAYRDRCVALTLDLFDDVFLLQPLPVYVVADGKPSDDPAYQTHIQALIEGAIFASRGTLRITPIDTFNPEIRLAAVLNAVSAGRQSSGRGTSRLTAAFG